jgi:hypothetical protein
VLANVIQADTILSGTTQPALPLQSTGPSARRFASTLQNARQNGSPLLSRWQTEPAKSGGRERLTEKNSARSSKTPASGQVAPEIKSALVENATAAVSAANLKTMPAFSLQVAGSLVPPGYVPSFVVSSGSDTASGLATGKVAKQAVSEGSEGQVQIDASTQNLATVSGFRVSAAAQQVISFSPDERQTASANLSAPAQTLSPPIADFIGTPGHGDLQPALSALTQGGTPLPAIDLTSAAADALAGSRQSVSGSKPLAGNGDLRNVPATATLGMPSHAADSTASVKAAAEVNQAVLESKPHSGNSSRQDDLAALSSSVIASRAAFAAEILKPGLLHAAMSMKAADAVLPADARAKDTPASPIFANQEQTRSKPTDSPANPPGATVQALLSSPAPAIPSGQVNGNQPGIAAATANVLTQVSPAASQDSGSRSAASPAAERQPPAEIASTSLPAPGTVEVARLVAGVTQAEMHIGLRTQAFGSVEVHTVVRDSQLGLTVGSERGDLRTLLATEVSSLQTTFRQQDLRFDNIRFLETSAGTTAGFSGGGDSQSRSSSQQHSSTAGLFSIHSPPEDPVELEIGAGSRARLNVHA